MAKQEATLLEVGVLRDNHEAESLRIAPDGSIRGISQANIPDIYAVGVEIGKNSAKIGRQILVEEKLRPGSAASFRSRPAAKARQARITSSEGRPGCWAGQAAQGSRQRSRFAAWDVSSGGQQQFSLSAIGRAGAPSHADK